MSKEKFVRTYTVLLGEKGFPIVHQCIDCLRPVRYAPFPFQDPGEACNVFETFVCVNVPFVTLSYVSEEEFFSSVLKDAFNG